MRWRGCACSVRRWRSRCEPVTQRGRGWRPTSWLRSVDDASPPALRAGLAYARGRVLLAEGDHGASTRELRTALRLWREVGSAYEIARTRAALSRALRACR